MKLLTKTIRKKLKPLGTHKEIGWDSSVAVVKFFLPKEDKTWYASEFDGKDTFFGVETGDFTGFCEFNLSELKSMRNRDGEPVKRDTKFEPEFLTWLKEYYEAHRYVRNFLLG